MWILPNNYPLSYRYVQDMAGSKQDLTSLASLIESSLMWRSKPSLLRTWLTRWKRVSWFRRLCGRILKPSRWDCFEAQLTSLLAATRVNRSQQQDNAQDPLTPGTYGPISARLYGAYDPDAFFSRMSMVTLASGLTKSSQTWRGWVTEQRGEYSQRVKSAHSTNENGCSLWATPRADKPTSEKPDVWKQRQAAGSVATPPLALQASMGEPNHKLWPTPHANASTGAGTSARDHRSDRSSPEYAEKHNAHPRGKTLTWKMTNGTSTGQLNPDWVEWLMGVPRNWTALGLPVTPHDGHHVEPPIPRVTTDCLNRVDRIRLLGNGVVPQTACKAWMVLDARLRGDV